MSNLTDKQAEEMMFGRQLTKEDLKRLEKKDPLYRMYSHEEDELVRMMYRYRLETQFMGGPILSHKEVPNKRGWLLPFLKAYEELFWGRWDYWGQIVLNGTIDGSGPIPQIEWCKDTNMTHQVNKMLQDCMNFVRHEGATIDQFADWLLWGFGMADKPPKVSAKVNEHWYRTFDLALVLKYPTDYFSRILEVESGRGTQSALGYFSTPFSVTELMTQIVFADKDSDAMKYEKFYEPCVGCGAMLLPASNYCLFGYAQDINGTAVKLCKVQMVWYAPWFALNPFA